MPAPRQLPFESESSDQDGVAPAGSGAARVPRARAAVLLAVAAAALVLLAVAGRSAGAATVAGREAVVSMVELPSGYGGFTEDCIVYGYGEVSQIGVKQPQEIGVSQNEGWIWLVNTSTVDVQGKFEELNGHIGLTEITIGGSALFGGVVQVGLHESTWFPPSGPNLTILNGENSSFSLPTILNASVTDFDTSKKSVDVEFEDFQLAVSEWGQSVDDHFMSMKLVMDVDATDTGICVNGQAFAVSDADNLEIHHSPSPSGDTLHPAHPAYKHAHAHHLANASDKSGTADTLLHFSLTLGFASSIVPFVL